MSYRRSKFITPGRLIIISLLTMLGVGTFLLTLPISHTAPLDFLDILFTSASAVSVTGLLTIPLQSFTFFGQCIILLLIQVGGLGIITLMIFLMSLFLDLGLHTHFLAGTVLDLQSNRSVKRLIKFIVVFTLFIECMGALAVWFTLGGIFSGSERIFFALFHAVSSFCNAGFDFFPNSLVPFAQNAGFLLITAILVTIGGLGFLTWSEILHYLKSLRAKKHFHLSLHSQLVIQSTIFIIATTFILFWVLERYHFFDTFTMPTSIVNIFFNAVCSRSTGFTTFNLALLRLPTIFVIILVSFVGSSPGSTGSGIKTTTFAIFAATIRAVLIGKNNVEIKGRTIPNDQVFKALAIFSLSLTWIALAVFILLLSEENASFLDVTFETFSAFSNVGYSVGLTTRLTAFGKLLITIVMLLGRIGSLTLLLALKRQRSDVSEIRYPEEKVMLS